MLTPAQQERIVQHLENGWKLPDSLVQELWSAYKALEESQQRPQGEGEDRHGSISARSKGKPEISGRSAHR